MTKKKSAILVLSILLCSFVLLSAGCTKQADKAPQTVRPITVKIGASSTAFGIQWYVAKEQGFFKKYGIEPEIVTYAYGIDTINAALNGQVDIGEANDFPVLSRLSNGDLKIVSFILTGKAANNKFVTRDRIISNSELKGKKVGVPRGTVTEYIFKRYLTAHNIQENEVIKVNLTSQAEIQAAFERGDIQAAFFSGLWLEKALKVPGSTIIGSAADIPFEGRGFAVVREQFYKQNPDAVRRVLLALDEASQWISQNPEGAGEVGYKAVKLPKEGLSKEVKDNSYDIRLSQEDVKQLADVYEWSVQNNLIKGGFDLKDKILTEPLKLALPDKLTYDPAKL
ncbi:MAG: ABC transporter substrate-binding protein [Bacillota bacterium]